MSNAIAKASKIFEIFKSINPAPKTELEYDNLFTLLIAVSLSAQTTDIAVNKATKALFAIAKSPEQMLELDENNLRAHLKTLNLYITKSKNIIKLSRILVEEYGGSVPLDFDSLIKLPGVGRKTANVVLNCWAGSLNMPVDTHVFRVSKRIGIAIGKTPNIVERELMENIPSVYLQYAHHWLILHGRYICKAKKPECNRCPISNYCDYYSEASSII